jgi:type II secretory pathway component GspD/PulD (secretin)
MIAGGLVTAVVAVSLLVAGPMTVELFELSFMNADEALPTVTNLLGPTGKASANRAANALIVNDTPENIAIIRSVLADLDRRPATYRLTAETVSLSTLSRVGLRLSLAASLPGMTVSTIPAPARDGVGLSAVATDRSTSSTRRQTIRLTEGKPGRLFVGEERPMTRTESRRSPWGASSTAATIWRRAGSALLVTVRPAGPKGVRVELAVEESAHGEGGLITGREATTQLILAEGERMVVAESGGESDTDRVGTGGGATGVGEERFMVVVTVSPLP